MESSSGSGRLEVLQALRAISAAFVVLFHSFYTYSEKIAPVDLVADAGLSYDLATFGVKLLFCISGFIIYKSSVALDPGWASAMYFGQRRLIRIVPLYWTVTTVYALKLAILGFAPSAFDVLRSFFFIPFVGEGHQHRPVLGAGWTLNFEMLFYAVLCAALLLKRNCRLVAVAAVLVCLVSAHFAGWGSVDYALGETAWSLLADVVLLFFLAGMGVASLVHKQGVRGPLPGTVLGGVLLVTTILLAFAVPASIFGLEIIGGRLSPVVLIIEIVICFALVYVSVKPYRRSRLADWLVRAGDGSYSTYLLHGFVMGPAARGAFKLGVSMGPWPFAMVMVLVCTAIGMLVYRYVEKPTQDALNARVKKPGMVVVSRAA